MVKLVFDKLFIKKVKKLDQNWQKKIKIQIKKIAENPQIGKPMRYSRKGTREVYLSPYRISYLYENDTLYIADLYHKDQQ